MSIQPLPSSLTGGMETTVEVGVTPEKDTPVILVDMERIVLDTATVEAIRAAMEAVEAAQDRGHYHTPRWRGAG